MSWKNSSLPLFFVLFTVLSLSLHNPIRGGGVDIPNKKITVHNVHFTMS